MECRLHRLTWIHTATVMERITLVACRTTADGNVISHFAVGANAALADASIDADTVLTGLIQSALDVIGAFTSSAVGEGIAAVARWTRADGTSAERLLTDCTGSAWTARAALSCKVLGKNCY